MLRLDIKIVYHAQFKSWSVQTLKGEILSVWRTFVAANAQYWTLTGRLFPYGGENWPIR